MHTHTNTPWCCNSEPALQTGLAWEGLQYSAVRSYAVPQRTSGYRKIVLVIVVVTFRFRRSTTRGSEMVWRLILFNH